MLNSVKNVIVVLSGKGGVGKSTVSTQIALAFHSQGFKVGLLDIDICGPSVPYLLKLEDHTVFASTTGSWIPVYADNEKRLAVMSIAFLGASRDGAIIWRGPKKTGMIKKFIDDVLWDEIDYLIVDTPPGTSDEHMTLVEVLKGHNSFGAIVVTTPQNIAVEDACREVTFCKKTGLPIIGIIENMSTYVCPNCSECTNLFSSGGGAALASASKTALLGILPIDPTLCDAGNLGQSLLVHYPSSPAAPKLVEVATKILEFFQVSNPS